MNENPRYRRGGRTRTGGPPTCIPPHHTSPSTPTCATFNGRCALTAASARSGPWPGSARVARPSPSRSAGGRLNPHDLGDLGTAVDIDPDAPGPECRSPAIQVKADQSRQQPRLAVDVEPERVVRNTGGAGVSGHLPYPSRPAQ